MKWIVRKLDGSEKTIKLSEEEVNTMADRVAYFDVYCETFCNIPMIDLDLLDPSLTGENNG